MRQCHEIFSSGFFHESSSPQAPGNNNRGISNFFLKFTEIFARQGAPNIRHRCQRHWQQIFLPPVSITPVSKMPAVNLPSVPLVSLVAIIGIKSDCLHLKVILKKNIYLYVYSTTQRCPNKIFKIFLIEGFFHLPLVSTTLVCTLSCEYLRE
jgi:hypothetical protein